LSIKSYDGFNFHGIKNRDGFNVHTIVDMNTNVSQEMKEKTYHVLRENGVTSGEIIEGFRSPLDRLDESLLLPKRLAQLYSGNRFYIQAMTLPMPKLEEEAKERRDDKYGDYAISHAVRFDGMEAVLVRLQRAWSGSVSAQGKLGGTAIMQAALLQ
jgi:hypothetical protein